MKRFHAFRLDTVNHCLWRGRERVSLTPKAFDVLRYLVEHADRLVTQDEILEALWPDTYVNPEVVKKYILGIRKVLGDQPDKPVFVATFPRRGYQFIAPVQDESIAAHSEITSNAMEKFVGRRDALAQLGSCLAKSLQGQRQVVFVTGEAGIGKTTLVDLFHQQAAFRPDLHVARGQCVEGFGGKEPYYPVLEALGQLFRRVEGSPAVQVLINRAPTWLIQFPSLVKVEQREALQKEILGATRQRMVREICEVLEALTAQNPLILILEDMHWVDDSTLDVVSALARRREPAKLLLLGTYRLADVITSQGPLKALKQDLLVHNLSQEIALARLEESDVAQYVNGEFPDACFSAGLGTLIHRQSGGNALFMRTILEDMVKKGLVVPDQKHGWMLSTPLEKIAPGVPDTLREMIDVQFGQLSEPEQRILRSASVAGERFSVWSISAAVDLEPAHIENLCEGLVERQQFIAGAGIDELANGDFSPSYEFKHSLYREAIYRGLSDVNRAKLHRGVAERVKVLCDAGKTELASELALHLEGARDHEQAVRYLILASENASKRFAYQDAIRILQQALDLAAKVRSRARIEVEIEILDRIGDAHYVLGEMTESARAFEMVATRAADAGLKAAEVNALCCLARATVLVDGDVGIAACQRALKACEGANDPLLLTRTELLAATLRLGYDQWRREDAETCAGARQTIARLSDPACPSYHEIWDTHRQSLQGEYQEAIKTADSGISKYYQSWNTDRQILRDGNHRTPGTAGTGSAGINESSSLAGYILALSARAIALMHVGRFGEALDVVQTARSRAEKNGSNAWIFMLREAWLRILVFDFPGAQRLCEEVAGASAQYLSGQPTAIAAIAGGYAALYEQDCERALRAFREVLDRDTAPKFFLHWYWRMQAELGMTNAFLQKGDIARAHSEAERFHLSALSTADPNLQVLAWVANARLAMAEEKWKESEKCLQQALAILEKFTVPLSAWRVYEASWKLHGLRQDNVAAENDRSRAEAAILALANSFKPDEPLRSAFLAAPPVRHILDGARPRS
jgi:DNA-binding winged helix-turn-helix (wHTH) protein/tetratricopeptide (TPR) repeat protein